MSVLAASMPSGVSSAAAAIAAAAIHPTARADRARPVPVARCTAAQPQTLFRMFTTSQRQRSPRARRDNTQEMLPHVSAMTPRRDGGDAALLVNRLQLQGVEGELVLPPAI